MQLGSRKNERTRNKKNTMVARRYNFQLTDYQTGKSIKLPEDLGRECKNFNITVKEILDNYNDYQSVGMRVTYADGALKAIWNKKKMQTRGVI